MTAAAHTIIKPTKYLFHSQTQQQAVFAPALLNSFKQSFTLQTPWTTAFNCHSNVWKSLLGKHLCSFLKNHLFAHVVCARSTRMKRIQTAALQGWTPPSWTTAVHVLPGCYVHVWALLLLQVLLLAVHFQRKHGLLNYTEDHHNSNLANERQAATELSK